MLNVPQSVLIHSAAGGVGIAAIQLARYKKADVSSTLIDQLYTRRSRLTRSNSQIFVTVGTDEKREYLANNFGIPRNRIFSSRNTKFAEEIRRETGGRGCDVILNSLIGELLDESWRLTADGGTMVEIGKRDIVDRNTLAMEPFERNCAFRGLDLAYTKEISNELIGRYVFCPYFAIQLCAVIITDSTLTSTIGSLPRSSTWSRAAISNQSIPSPCTGSTRLFLHYPIFGVGSTWAKLSSLVETRKTRGYPSDRQFVNYTCSPMPRTSSSEA